MYPRGAGASSTRKTTATAHASIFFHVCFPLGFKLWICKRTNLIHRQLTMKRLVDLPLEASSIIFKHWAFPLNFGLNPLLLGEFEALCHCYGFFPFQVNVTYIWHLIRQFQDRCNKQNVLKFLRHGAYHVLVRGGSYFCQLPKSGGSGVFFLSKREGGADTFFWKKCQNSPPLPPSPLPRKKRTFP